MIVTVVPWETREPGEGATLMTVSAAVALGRLLVVGMRPASETRCA